MHSDHETYFGFSLLSRLNKSLETLVGILEGISIDSIINAREIDFLNEWIRYCDDVRHLHPFNELIPVINTALADGVLTEEEKLDILWLCNRLDTNGVYVKGVLRDMQQLHGVLGGILADGKITEAELTGLTDWLSEHDHLKTCWPYDEVESLVSGVMLDGKIDDQEQLLLQRLFSEFIQLADDKTITNPPTLMGDQIVGLCTFSPAIKFEGSWFCFTGASPRFKRRELKEVVERLGGKFTDSMSGKVDYLVIGAEGNPCWAYACYGRKVEAAVNYRKTGRNVQLVHEIDFHDAVSDVLGT
ncbi:BRCT domain-containing protein [Geomonas anaerohicana]|uniref:BRCT domain-containing protein n=1 Tax=Geomonas anaerohicana TaxID=2798583 RepID=A0ABS0YH58_9BACT|nr:BRCT domain-containing protein [Geomonas anaerohicana]MBJ6751232.1 BRCT domain-containing protein [Geomonas anaerohicana]